MAELKAGTTIGGFRAIHSNNLIRILKSKDGSGSGVDADLLDGHHADYFVKKSGDTMTGVLTINNGATLTRHASFQLGYNQGGAIASDSALRLYSNSDGNNATHEVIQLAAAEGLTTDNSKGLVIYKSSIKFYNNTVWHAGNDGSGSGLDADLLDGHDSTYFVKKSGDTMTGALDVMSNLRVRNNAGADVSLGFTNDNTTPRIRYGGSGTGSTSGFLIQGSGDSTKLKIDERGDLFAAGTHKVWHTANVGSGSGLDSDKLDGLHSGSFLRTDADSSLQYGKVLGINHTSSTSPSFNPPTNTGICGGKDAANATDANLRLYSWYGIGFVNTIANQPVPQYENATWFNVRSGNVYTRGNYYAGSSNLVWHQGNDGSGSGLDADLLDGHHADYFVKKNGDTMTGVLGTPNNSRGILLGDDVYLCDRNIANHMILEGHADSTQAGITFGSGKDTNIYRGGANLLKTDDTFNAVGGLQWNGQSLDARYSDRNLLLNNGRIITVAGESTKYYPVIINFNTNGTTYAFSKLSISRSYNDPAPGSWGQGDNVHKVSLTLSLLWSGDASWGGNSKTIQVLEFDEWYDHVVGGIKLCTQGLVVWLRGGSTQYRIDSEYGLAVSATIKLQDYTDGNNNVFRVRNDNSQAMVEIGPLYQNRKGQLYDSNQRVYSPLNKPTPEVIGAVNKAGDTMTGSLKFTISATTSSTTQPLQLGYNEPTNTTGYGYMASYGRIKILADTDNNGSEPIQLVTGNGLSTDETKGLVIWKDNIKYNNNPIWHAGNDGSGSGLDADLLDGLNSDRFMYGDGSSAVTHATDANALWKAGIYDFVGGRNLPTSDQWYWLINTGHRHNTSTNNSKYGMQLAAANGTDQFWFRTTGANGSGNWARVYTTRYKPTPADIGAVNKAGDTMTGALKFVNAAHISTDVTTSLQVGYTSSGSAAITSWAGIRIMGNTDKVNTEPIQLVTGEGITTDDSKGLVIWQDRMTFYNNKVWHAGNDGSGSGLDADLLDGLHSTAFVKRAGDTMTGTLTFNTTETGINWIMNTDFAKIYFKNTGDGDADSYLHFMTGDNGNEYMKFSIVNGSTTSQIMTIKSDGVRATKIWGAVYNDYAEYFEKGEEIEPGDVVVLNENSDKEEYVKCREANSSFVVGVCSDEFFQCIGGNGDDKDEENFTPIGMAGRVKVKLVGKAKKGDLITSSDIPGVAMVAENPKMGTIIGKCLENKETDEIERVRMLIQLS